MNQWSPLIQQYLQAASNNLPQPQEQLLSKLQACHRLSLIRTTHSQLKKQAFLLFKLNSFQMQNRTLKQKINRL